MKLSYNPLIHKKEPMHLNLDINNNTSNLYIIQDYSRTITTIASLRILRNNNINISSTLIIVAVITAIPTALQTY